MVDKDAQNYFVYCVQTVTIILKGFDVRTVIVALTVSQIETQNFTLFPPQRIIRMPTISKVDWFTDESPLAASDYLGHYTPIGCIDLQLPHLVCYRGTRWDKYFLI